MAAALCVLGVSEYSIMAGLLQVQYFLRVVVDDQKILVVFEEMLYHVVSNTVASDQDDIVGS